MARSGNASRPSRALFALVALLVVLYGAIAIGTLSSNAQWTPKLGLDLAGGTEMILQPKPQPGVVAKKITPGQLSEAVKIIRQRVNGNGATEAEVTTQNGNNIVVSLPGNPTQKQRDLVKQSAQMSFRAVLVEEPAATQPAATPTATPTPSPTSKAGKKAAKTKATPTAKSTASASPKPSATNGRIVPKALLKAAATPSAGAGAAPTGASISTVAPTDPSAATVPDPTATDSSTANAAATGTPSDLAQITQPIGNAFTAQTCTNLNAVQSQVDDPKKLLVTCDTGGNKFILGPVEVDGKNIKSATAGLGTNSQGFNTGEWQVNLNFDGTGTKAFANVTQRLAGLTGAQNQFAVVLDGLVVTAPGTNERIPNGQAQISGGFTQATATELAQQLKFGALPVSFQVQTEDQISAVLGGEQLQRGLLAGLIGLILVVAYSLLQYRALGLVTIFSLIFAGGFTYGTVVLLSWTDGFRLSLAAVTGLIVAIGITADSFIVYFERVRDEVREGRPLNSAVEAAWKRARRTILISDAVSFLAAVVLYVLAAGSVKGFAFTLGLTTLIDVLVVFLFTKPMVTLLSRTHFFGGGHRLSGFSPEQLGRVARYAGRGRVREPELQTQSIAARRAAEMAQQEDRFDSPDDGSDDDPGGGPGKRAANGRVSAGRGTGTRRDV